MEREWRLSGRWRIKGWKWLTSLHLQPSGQQHGPNTTQNRLGNAFFLMLNMRKEIHRAHNIVSAIRNIDIGITEWF
jgi:hypothetical protein